MSSLRSRDDAVTIAAPGVAGSDAVGQGVGHEAETLPQLFDQLLRVVEQVRELAELGARHLDR